MVYWVIRGFTVAESQDPAQCLASRAKPRRHVNALRIKKLHLSRETQSTGKPASSESSTCHIGHGPRVTSRKSCSCGLAALHHLVLNLVIIGSPRSADISGQPRSSSAAMSTA